MKTEGTELIHDAKGKDMVVSIEPSNLLEVIARAVANPKVDVEKMKSLLAMHKEIVADQREMEFNDALNRLQARIPQIEKDGRIIVKGQERSRYAKLETIDEAVKPLLTEEGFALSFDTESKDGRTYDLIAELSHRNGLTRRKRLLLPLDVNDFRSSVQNVGSTISYGKRQLTKAWFNIVEKGEDTDGNALDPITPDQAKDLNTMLQDVKADRNRFLAFMGAESIETILAKDYVKAVNALESKRKVPAK